MGKFMFLSFFIIISISLIFITYFYLFLFFLFSFDHTLHIPIFKYFFFHFLVFFRRFLVFDKGEMSETNNIMGQSIIKKITIYLHQNNGKPLLKNQQ